MRVTINKFKKPLICLALVMASIVANAQSTLLQNTITKLDGLQNYSYQCIEKIVEYGAKTTINQHNDLLQNAANDKNFGFLFRLETTDLGTKQHLVDIYNGQNLITAAFADSTYQPGNVKHYSTFYTLPTFLKFIKARPEKKPSQLVSDTTMNKAVYHHLIFHTYDTVINKEHYHTAIHVYLNKLTNLPGLIRLEEKTELGGSAAIYDMSFRYSNFKLNADGVDIANLGVPKGFHLPKAVKQTQLPLLSIGTTAPNWTLTTTDGKKISLAQLKGKVVLMDLFFVGCGNCIESLPSLDKIDKKYKRKDFALVSISTRDNRKVAAGFKKTFHIKNVVLSDGQSVERDYRAPGAPLFYFIDKDGKIGGVELGYSADFEKKATAIIDGLLKK